MKKKVTLLTIFVLLLSSLTMLNAQPPAGLTEDQWKVLLASTAHTSRAIEAEKKPLGRLLTGEAHRDVRPLIIEYVATAPTFIEAVRNIAGLAWTNKALKDVAIEELKKRIEQGAKTNQKDIKSHATDLLFEVVKSEKPIPLIAVEALIGTGADVNAKDQDGNPPLLWAAQEGHTQIVDALIGANADVNVKDQNDDTPLHLAAYKGHTQIVDALIRAKNADVNVKGMFGNTPLLWAAGKGHKEIVDALIRANADLNAKEEKGNTPLHVAALNGQKEIVDTLIRANADVNAKTTNGYTPLHWAAGQGYKKVVQQLLNAGADKTIKNNQGETPYDVALARNPEIKRLLE